jgi:hypothetical protein
MKRMLRLFERGVCYFAVLWCTVFTGMAWDEPVSGFSQVHFDGTFVMLGQHILDTSDLGVLLARANPHFRDLSKSDRKDLSWDSAGVRYTADSRNIKVTWVVDPAFLHEMEGHPTHVFNGKLSIFEIDLVRNKSVPEALLSQYGFEAAPDKVPRNYLLKKNGWQISIITDRDRAPEAVTLEHSLTPE